MDYVAITSVNVKTQKHEPTLVSPKFGFLVESFYFSSKSLTPAVQNIFGN